MGYSEKYIRAYLSSLGHPGSAGDFFHARCCQLWGNDGWQVESDGIRANGKLVVALADYPMFMSGLPYTKDGIQMEVVRIEPVIETGEIVPGDPLCCQICGRRTATPVGMETHMRIRHDGAPNVAPTPPPPPPPQVEEAAPPKVDKKAKKGKK